MSKHYSYLVTSAIIEGIFIGFNIRTGVDASPISLAKKTIEILEPLISSNMAAHVETIRFALDAIGVILLLPIAIDLTLLESERAMSLSQYIFWGINFRNL